MKKLLFVMMLLVIAAPVMAAEIKATDEGSGVVRIDYIRAASEQRIRAFGLNVAITSGNATPDVTTPIVAGSYKTDGVSTSTSKGFGIYPGTIVIDGNTITNAGSPKAPNGATGALAAPGLTLELGSLYKGDVNSPAPGTAAATVQLCKIKYTGTGSSTLTLAPNATRGNVVFEDGTAASPTYTGCTIVFVPVGPPPVPTGLAASDGTSATSNALTWGAVSGATSYNIKYNSKNDLASAVVLATSVATNSYTHTTNHGETTWYWVCANNGSGSSDYSTSDSGYLTECMPNTVPAKKTRWVTYGRPDCWCYARNCKGDATGTSDGKAPSGPYWVSVGDLNVLKSAWNKLDAALTGNQICADFSRSSDGKAPSGPYAVSVGDLNILKSNWNIVNGPASGLCEATKAVVAPSGPMP